MTNLAVRNTSTFGINVYLKATSQKSPPVFHGVCRSAPARREQISTGTHQTRLHPARLLSALTRRSRVSLGALLSDASPSRSAASMCAHGPCAHMLAADLDGDASCAPPPSETLERLSSALLPIQSELSSDASPWRSAHALLALSGRLHGRREATFSQVPP